MTQAKWALVLAITTGILVGCAEQAPSESADRALAHARARLTASSPDLEAAYDYLLAGMRISPGSTDVFVATAEFIEQAASGDEDAISLAHDLYIRADGLIPFQSVDDIAQSRRRHRKLGELFQSPPSVVRNPFESLAGAIKHLQSTDCPPELSSVALQQVGSELDAAAVQAVGEKATAPEEVWKSWRHAATELKAAESLALAKRYEELVERHADFIERSQRTLIDCEKAESDQLNQLGQRVVSHIDEAYRLRGEISPFVDAMVPTAEDHAQQLEGRLDLLQKTREWMHNQHALNTISFLQDVQNEEKTPLENLRRLARCDERRFTPYVLVRYQQEWDRWFDELETDQQRIEAAKMRVLNGVRIE